jgi:hypothetical protein
VALRRWLLGVLALGGFGVLVLAAAWIVLGPRPSDPFAFRSAAGGFSLGLPGGWRVGDGNDHDDDGTYTWFEARRPMRFGPATAWLYLSRGPATGEDPMATAREYSLDAIRAEWSDVDVEIDDITIAGRDGIRMRFRRPMVEPLAFLPGGDVEEVRYLTRRGEHVYELGIAGWRNLPGDVSRIVSDLELFTPSGERTVADDDDRVTIDLPGAWNEHDPESYPMPNAVLVASTPQDGLPDSWLILWRYEDSYADAVRASVADAEDRGTLLGQEDTMLAGNEATLVRFTLPREDVPGDAHLVTWIIDGPDGRAWQLLVGSAVPDDSVALEISGSLRFL